MPDAQVLLLTFRDELAALDRRRAELRGQLEALDAAHDRLATAVSVLEERVGAVSQSGSSDSLDDVPLADRILAALGGSGLRRAEMLPLFTAQGFTPSAIDSAVNRLKRRRAVRRHGRRIVRVPAPSGSAEPLHSASADADVLDLGAAPSSGSEAAGRGSGDPAPTGGVSDSAPTGAVAAEVVVDDDDRFLTERVREAVAAGIDTRKELLKYFAGRGVKGSSVDDAVSGLRKRGVLDRLPGRKLAVVAGSEASVPVESESQPS